MEDVLLELEHSQALEQARIGMDHLDALREALEHLQRAYHREVGKAARSLVGSAQKARDAWQSICRAVIAGYTDKAHASRTLFLADLRARSELLKRVHEGARRLGNHIPEVDDLLPEIAELEKLHAKLSARWLPDDPESLQYLVAEELTPPAEKLKAIAAKHAPPRAWYDEE